MLPPASGRVSGGFCKISKRFEGGGCGWGAIRPPYGKTRIRFPERVLFPDLPEYEGEKFQKGVWLEYEGEKSRRDELLVELQ